MTVAASQPEKSRLGDFEIGREIGRGGMGVVYEARQVSLNRRVALKVLSGGLGLTPKAVQRFRREAEAAAKLHHTNIVPIYATGEQDGIHFYAMELIDGPSLDHVIQNMRDLASGGRPDAASSQGAESHVGRIENPSYALAQTGPYVEGSPASSSTTGLSSSSLGSGSGYFDTVARLMAEVADALDYAHQQGVVHRDMKPSNLLLSPSGRLSINDFGLARMLEQPGMTMSGEFVGTPAYMSPEQIAVGRIPQNHRTDIYSLGATLYELLTLEPPHKGQSREQVLAQIVHKEPKPPRRINKKVPIDLETICLKCLEKDPDRRYQTAGRLAEDLRRYVNRFAISARRIGPVGRIVKWIRRRPAVAASQACVALAIGVAVFFAVQAEQAEERHRRLVAEAKEQQEQEDRQREERERALHNALAAAMGGELDKAETAIREARGASPGQLLMLQGQVAFERGDWARGLVALEEAVQMEPDNVAARGLLAMAYLGFGDWNRHAQTVKELEGLTPQTAEDYLFRGYARREDLARGRGLQDLDEAVKLSPSPLARAIRAHSRMLDAEDQADLEEAERAVADVQEAKSSLVDNAYVLSVSVWVHVVAANLYLEAGKPGMRRAALEIAERDARALKTRDTWTSPFWSLWVYFEQTGGEQACFDLAHRAFGESDAPAFAYHYALALYRRGEFEEAQRALERRKWNAYNKDFVRVFILAELKPQDPSFARAALEEMAKRDKSRDYRNELFRLLGYKDDAIALSRAERQEQPPTSDEFSKRGSDYLCGDISENEYVKAAGRSRVNRCVAHYHIALTCLAERDRAGAREHLHQAVEIRLADWGVSDFSRCLLARMKKDENWPPWISMKKDQPKP